MVCSLFWNNIAVSNFKKEKKKTQWITFRKKGVCYTDLKHKHLITISFGSLEGKEFDINLHLIHDRLQTNSSVTQWQKVLFTLYEKIHRFNSSRTGLPLSMMTPTSTGFMFERRPLSRNVLRWLVIAQDGHHVWSLYHCKYERTTRGKGFVGRAQLAAYDSMNRLTHLWF